MDVSKDKLHLIIAEIADHNDCGMNAYIHRKTLKLIFIPKDSFYILDDFDDAYEADKIEVEKHLDLYFKIEPPSSSESYNIMVDFIESLDQTKLKNDLTFAINKKRPFANFKHIIDRSDKREDWFEFKNQKLVHRVKIEFEYELPEYMI